MSFLGAYQVASPWRHFRGQFNNNTGLSPYVGSSTNKLKWSFSTGATVASSAVIASDGTIYIGSDSGAIFALTSDTGSIRWKFTTDSSDGTGAIGVDGTIYIGTVNNGLYALSPQGTTLWSFSTFGITSSPAITSDGSTLYVGSEDFHMYSFSTLGSLKWSYSVGNLIDSSPAIGIDGSVYVGSQNQKLYSWTATGSLRWSYLTGGFITSSPLLTLDGTVYIGSTDQYLYSFTTLGSVKWKRLTGNRIYGSPAMGPDGTIYIGSGDSYLYAFNSLGTVKWKYLTGDIVYSHPTVGADGVVYFGSNDYNLYAINPQGSVLWKYTTRGTLICSPAIGADGTIYFGSSDYSVYAILGTVTTKSPTLIPTVKPTVTPTVAPSSRPSVTPSILPSIEPTISLSPTLTPSSIPSRNPSSTPTVSPTTPPTVQPSVNPTQSPTVKPTFSPTSTPSVQPTVSVLPTELPTVEPSRIPVACPTVSPSIVPTVSPSISLSPLIDPTTKPSEIPSLSPTLSPSLSPSISPSAIPFDSPTEGPTRIPTSVPSSLAPSASPSAVPTIAPSTSPSKKPTLFPSLLPSSIMPSYEPSMNPSHCPSDHPTMTPSTHPSVAVTTEPATSASASASNTQQQTTIIAVSVVGAAVILFMLVAAYFFFFGRRSTPQNEGADTKDVYRGDMELQALYDGFGTPGSLILPDRISRLTKSITLTKPKINPKLLLEIMQIPWPELSSTAKESSQDDGMIVGEGSFGFVLKAVWRPKSKASKKAGFMSNVPKDVAIKVLKLTQQDSKGAAFDEAVLLVKQEASVMKDAERLVFSDCIAKVYGIVQGPIPDVIAKVLGVRSGTNSVGIVMRYEAGGDLSRYLHGDGKYFRELTLIQKLHLLVGIASGLTELHGAGIIHGDIKPENILLSSDTDPEVRLSDFGLAFMREEASNTASQIFKSSLQETYNARAQGTPIYSAPEMMFNPLESNENTTIAKASRKTDVYAFAILAWEIMTQKYPFGGIKLKEQLSYSVHQNIRPSLDDIPYYTPSQVTDMIQSCWSKARARRLLASQCYSIVSWHHQQLTQTTFDIFLSHAHTSKPFLSFVYKELTKCGYRVWFDQVQSNQDSLFAGIASSKLFLACVDSSYQDLDTCMAELEEAKLKANKTIVTLIVEENPFVWATARLRDLCSFQSSLFVDVSGSASQDWESESGATPAALDQLRRHMGPLIRLLDESGCKPVYAPRVLTNAAPAVYASSTASSVSAVQSALSDL